MATQYVGNDETQRTDTRHRHKSNSRKSSNEGNQEHRNRAAKQRQSHSPQISMTFCPEKCNCGFKNQTNQLEVNHFHHYFLSIWIKNASDELYILIIVIIRLLAMAILVTTTFQSINYGRMLKY